MAAIAKTRISIPDAYRVNKLLEEHFTLDGKVDEEGKKTGHYAHGWSDARIAKKAGPKVTPSHVYHLRTTIFGYILDASRRQAMRAGNRYNIQPLINPDDLREVVNRLINKSSERFEELEASVRQLKLDVSADDSAFDHLDRRIGQVEETLDRLLKDLGSAEEMAAAVSDAETGEDE